MNIIRRVIIITTIFYAVAGFSSNGTSTAPFIGAGVVGGFFVMITAFVLTASCMKMRKPKYPQFGRKIEGML